MKRRYEAPAALLLTLGTRDAITTSGDNWLEWDTEEE
jgi:hypothetical protein